MSSHTLTRHPFVDKFSPSYLQKQSPKIKIKQPTKLITKKKKNPEGNSHELAKVLFENRKKRKKTFTQPT